MSHALTVIGLSCLLRLVGSANAEIEKLQFGSENGRPWTEWTAMNLMVDDTSVPGAIQPLRLRPHQNVVPQLQHWTRYRQPIDHLWRAGMPRVWRAIGDETSHAGHGANPLIFIDGDVGTHYANLDYIGGGLKGHVYGEYYTLDMGLPVPAERFVLVPPDGKYPSTGEPYRPNFHFKFYELTASNDAVLVESQVAPPGEIDHARVDEYYKPLDIQLASVGDNHESVIEIGFPLQYLRFFRFKVFADGVGRIAQWLPEEPMILRYAIAELEVYGRGFVPHAVWESQVIDLKEVMNVGKVALGVSRWRVHGEELSRDPEAASTVSVQLKTGFDEEPTAYYSYNELGYTVEITENEYTRLKSRTSPGHPEAVGRKGPIGQDTRNWSFWSTPVRSSGERPRVPKGRYVKLLVELATEGLWEFIRVDSMAVEVSPLLATRILGEVAVADELQPEHGQPVVRAGEMTEFVYDMAAEFEADEPGFDAVRVIGPSSAELLELRMGGDGLETVELRLDDTPPLETPEPDCPCATWAREPQGFLIYLPEQKRISQDGERRLRLKLETAVYGVTGELAAEAVDQAGTALPQAVEAGDVSEELGTDSLRLLTQASSLGEMLGAVVIEPEVVTPQGDGVNEEAKISYTLFRVLEGAEVQVGVYTLAGAPIWRESPGRLGGGPHDLRWRGRDDADQLVPPGLYLVRVEVETDEGREARIEPVAVVY